MLKHIVAWNHKDIFSSDEKLLNAEKIKEELESLKSLIPEIVEIKVTVNPVSSSNRDVVLYSLFGSEDDLKRYQVHPEHKRVSAFVGSVMQDRICLDFYE
ncbi:MAG: stress protein [Firmicutes bacterium HGW-Firmicutes-21]|nr:MAG: stress protein [Firmicutes bacterium HGW-Firmicutes-21]